MLLLLIVGFTFLNARLINSYGVKGGLVVANQDFKHKDTANYLDTKNHYGMRIGTFLEIFPNSITNLLIEASYIQKGMKPVISNIYVEETFNSSDDTDFSYRVDYLSLPALIKYSFSLTKPSPYIILGPRVDIFLGYKSKHYLFDSIYEDFKSIDFGGAIGLGYEFNHFLSQTFLLEIRFSPTFTNSYKTDLLKVKNRSFEFLTGIKFK